MTPNQQKCLNVVLVLAAVTLAVLLTLWVGLHLDPSLGGWVR